MRGFWAVRPLLISNVLTDDTISTETSPNLVVVTTTRGWFDGSNARNHPARRTIERTHAPE